MKKYKAILFDLDGTLADTCEGVYASVKYAAEKERLPEADDALLKKFIGPPLHQTFRTEYGLSEEGVDKAVAAFREFYGREGVYMCTPYEGMDKLLVGLKNAGYKIGTATYKREDYAKALLKRKLPDVFDVIHGADPEGKLTKADIVEKVIAELGADKTDTVLVGDSFYDAEGAAAAGVDFIAVTYGFGFRFVSDTEKYPTVNCCTTVRELAEAFGV